LYLVAKYMYSTGGHLCSLVRVALRDFTIAM